MIVTLPYPPSANRYLRHTARGTYRTAEATHYRANAARLAIVAGFLPVAGPVSVAVSLHPRKTANGK